jgi:mono/diheme cytochrome c family protein
LTPHLKAFVVAASTIALLSAGGVAASIGTRSTDPSATRPAQGKKLYRKYCGQCHALDAALAAGFGSNNGLGTNGGPSFNNLRVPFSLSVLAVKQPFIGHEVLIRKMTWAQVTEVAAFVANVTKHHPVLAQFTDG